jgi:hypothetical protein
MRGGRFRNVAMSDSENKYVIGERASENIELAFVSKVTERIDVAVMLMTLRVPGLNFGGGTGYPDFIEFFFLVPAGKYIGTWLKRHRFIRHLAYTVRYSVVPTNSSLLTITLYSSVVTKLVYNDTRYSVPLMTL